MFRTIVFLTAFPLLISAQEMSFEQYWEKLQIHSKGQKRMQVELESQQLAAKRVGKHWLPKAYVGAQSYRTNDPGTVFFSNLGQRSVNQNDFNPSQLNYPGASWYQRASIGVDMPLYEGGMKQAQAESMQEAAGGKEYESKAFTKMEYSDVASSYGNLLINRDIEVELVELRNKIDQVLSNYKLGQSQNPVGHSGMLGLKNVKNRIDGFLKAVQIDTNHHQHNLAKRIDSTSISLPKTKLMSFIENTFQRLNESPSQGSNYAKALYAYSKSQSKVSEMEKARYLPQVGLFAERQDYWGARNNAGSITAGVYLKWSIFNATDLGTVEEARLKAESIRMKGDEQLEQEQIAMASLIEARKGLRDNMNILAESRNFLNEQTIVTNKLFSNGLVNAIQLAEVYNRRVDLIEKDSQIQKEYLKVHAQLSSLYE